MKEERYHVALDDYEHGIIIRSLNDTKTELKNRGKTTDAVEALKNGQVDCVVIDNAPAQEYVKANPGLKILDTEFANEDYAIGVAKGNTELLDHINSVIADVTSSGEMDEMVNQANLDSEY